MITTILSTGLLCHKIGRLQLCNLLTLTQAIPTCFLFPVFCVSFLPLLFPRMGFVNPTNSGSSCKHRTFSNPTTSKSSQKCLCLTKSKFLHIYIFKFQVAEMARLVVNAPVPPEVVFKTSCPCVCLFGQVPKLLLSEHLCVDCSILCSSYIDRDARDSLFYGQSPRVTWELFWTMMLINSNVWRMEDEWWSGIKRETLLFDYITFLDLF